MLNARIQGRRLPFDGCGFQWVCLRVVECSQSRFPEKGVLPHACFKVFPRSIPSGFTGILAVLHGFSGLRGGAFSYNGNP